MINKSLYDKSFYESTHSHVYSAQKIFEIIFKHLKPRSIIDIGCGSGSWLKAASEMGVKNLTGIEGNWLKPEMLIAENINLLIHDISSSLPRLSKYDLAITLEVAEHLSESRSKSFIEDLCGLSDVVLFSAAIPHQGGDNHLNEQWQSYWNGLFRKNNFVARDIIRPIIWEDENIKAWYKQNCILYINEKIDSKIDNLRNQNPLDIVHPDIFWNNPDKYKFMQIIKNDQKIEKNHQKYKLLLVTNFIVVATIFLIFFLYR